MNPVVEALGHDDDGDNFSQKWSHRPNKPRSFKSKFIFRPPTPMPSMPAKTFTGVAAVLPST